MARLTRWRSIGLYQTSFNRISFELQFLWDEMRFWRHEMQSQALEKMRSGLRLVMRPMKSRIGSALGEMPALVLSCGFTKNNRAAMSLDIPFSQGGIQFRDAVISDAEQIAVLVNSAYRGDSSRQGWTTEADLLQGARIHAAEVRELILAEASFILLCVQNGITIGCVHLQKTDGAAYLGMFVVQPTLQGNGIGKQFMQIAEARAQQRWGIDKIWMTVISVRQELIAYYERRGYARTGRFKPFPSDNGKEMMLVENLQFEEMEKILT